MVTDKSWWNHPTTAGSISYTANHLNQYTAVGSASPTYDANGNLTSDGADSYCYDADSRLIEILSAGTCASPTTVVASYAYDAQGRRTSKAVGTSTTIYVTDADNREVLEYAGSSGAVSRWYAYAAGPNDVLNRMYVAGSSRQTLILDIQGSIVASVDASTGALTKTGYQPFGENPSLSSGSFQYTAARFDRERSFYYMRALACIEPTGGGSRRPT
jgi:YD repeat-containing protein